MAARDTLAAEALALLDRVLDLPDGERDALLADACRDRPALRARVEELLAWDARDHGTLDGDAARWSPLLLAEAEEADTPAGRMVGPYRVVEELGRGGMGAVYLAERSDGAFRQQVAIKLVKRGMDTDEILARFRHERHILASLDHPNIARLFDGGATEDGRPYLVMERVDGEAVIAYCDRLKLGIGERLTLFGTICQAVQHAHQRLVVHRDLKPSNILVTREGVPKLLDFGIAKLLGDDQSGEAITRTGVYVLTPEYASPEQLRGDPVTTASDVYALGTLLYELLSGNRPFSGRTGVASADDLPSPARPSTAVTRSVANRREPGRNPGPTPEEIAAARGTTPDRLRRRLAGDLDTIVLKALEQDPGRRYGTARELLEDLERHASSRPIRARPASTAYLVRTYLRRHRGRVAAGLLVVISLVGGLGAAIWQARAAARERDAAELARASSDQVNAFLLNLFESTDPLGLRPERTDTLPVRELVDRGANRVRTELAGQPRVQADLLTLLGRVYASLGNFPRSRELLLDAAALNRAAEVEGVPSVVPLAILGSVAQQEAELPLADSLMRRVLDEYETSGASPDSLYLTVLSDHGLVLSQLGRFDEAREAHEKALGLVVALGLEESTLHGRALANLATLHYDLGDYARAADGFRETARIEALYLPEDHPRHAASLNNLASSLHYQGLVEEAEPRYLEAIVMGRAALGDTHPEVGYYLQNLATLYDDQQRYEEAAPLYRASLVAHEASFGRRNVNTALLLRNLALNRMEVGELAEAEGLLREAFGVIEEGLGADHLYTAVTRAALGRVLLMQGRLDEAEGHIVAGLETLQAQLPPEHYLFNASLRDLGAYRTARGDYAAAEELLLASYAALRAEQGTNHYLTRGARARLRELYLAWGRPDRAAEFELREQEPGGSEG